MDLNRMTREADELIRKVVSRYNHLYSPSGAISQVELDLMLDDVRRMYDTFKQIGAANLSLQPLQQPKVEIEVANPAPVKPESQPALHPEPQKTAPAAVDKIAPAPEMPAPDEPKHEPEAELPQKELPKEPIVNENVTTRVPEDHHATLAEKFPAPAGKSISQTMATPQTVLGSRILQPITDLTTGINLHDKYSFIKELFSNDQLQYEEAIARVNKAVNFEEAIYILQKFHNTAWDENAETSARIQEFVKRRFV